MLNMILRMILLSVFLLSVIPGQSYGFDWEEHVFISRNAFLVSLTYAQQTGLINEDEAKSLRSCFDQDDDMNYGYLSAIVDDVTDPMKFIILYGPHVDVDGVDCSAAKALFRDHKVTAIDKLIASKYNEDHFGERTLTKFRQFHDLAQLYAIRGNLCLALVLNAFAVHYLEDFFAPGHLLSPRTDINNISALALHDMWNEKGAEISINMSAELMDYLDIIKKMKQIGDSEEGVKALVDLNGKYLTIYGDGLLNKSKGQKELLISEVAKTITAVIDAYKNHTLREFDSDYTVEVRTEKKSIPLVDMTYEYEEISPTFEDEAYVPVGRDYELARLVPIIEISPYMATPLRSGYNARWGLEVDLAMYITPAMYVKPRMVEDSTATDFFETFMIGVALGYDYSDEIFNTNNHSHGPMIKLIFDLKDSDIGFCLYAKWKFNDENDHTFQSFPFGGRVKFSRDFFALYAGLGNELRYTDKRENVITVYTGVTFYFPVGMTLFK